MVSSNHTDRNARPDDDPIAELSDIMKFDIPDNSSRQDLEIDLENELLGELSQMSDPESHAGGAGGADELEFSQDFDAAMHHAFAEDPPDEGLAENEAAPSVPPELESQLQALLAELGSEEHVVSKEFGVEGEADFDFGETEVAGIENMRGEADPYVAMDETGAAEDPMPAPPLTLSDDELFNDELGRAIAGLQPAPQDIEQPDIQVEAPEAIEEFDPVDLEAWELDAAPAQDVPANEGDDDAPADPEFDPAQNMDEPRQFAPEVDTAELPDAIEPLADDLDIPEIRYESEPQAQPDAFGFDGEFANEFDKIDDFDYQSNQYAQAEAEPEFDDYAGPTASAAVYAASPVDATQEEGGAYREPVDPYPYENSLPADDDFFAAIPSEAEMDNGGGRRRGILVAAALATVAIAGGLGYFALATGGADGDGPALVQADENPIKVKPQDPGGATAPNADKAVYDRVAGAGDVVAPSQEKLISTAEEPVNVEEAVSQPRVVLPSSSETALTEAVAPKADDRMVPDDTVEAAGEAEEFVAIEPRRVRTLIVKPDGTLVPREEAASPAVTEGLRTSTGSDALIAAAGQVAVEDDALAGLVDTSVNNEAAPTAPAPRENVAAAPAANPPAAAVPTPVPVPAATPQPAPAPQGGAEMAAAPANAPADNVEYWVQVSSQPTKELAQASYNDVAQRYGGLIAGRAVNIYPAEIEGRGTFYRVRVAGGSRSEANDLCNQLKNAGGGCFVSR